MRIARAAVFIVVGVLLGFVAYELGVRFRPAVRPTPPAARAVDATKAPVAAPVAPVIPDRSPASLLAQMFDRIRAGGLRPGELDAFRRALLGADPRVAAAAIRAFLATGQDARIGEAFTVGKGGQLAGASTFRVLLLDLLGRISRDAGSDEAEKVSRSLLTRKTSADEWAVALRNVAWSAPAERAYVAEKMAEMLDYQPWRQQPGAGFIEAFDVIPFTRDTRFIAGLGGMVQGEDAALRRAAAVAMDRLSEMAPLDVMNYLNAHPAEFSNRPFLRADYFSKADLSQPAQRQAVETYLSRIDVFITEKEKLLAVFASPGSFVSDSLVTMPPVGDDPPERKAALLKTVGEWLQVNQFPDLTEVLVRLRRRLAE